MGKETGKSFLSGEMKSYYRFSNKVASQPPQPQQTVSCWKRLQLFIEAWLHSLPLMIGRRLWKIVTDWKTAALIIALIFFFYPGAYRFCVDQFFPHAYYSLGSLGNPAHEFTDLPEWHVDMNWIDNTPKGERWQRFAEASRQIAYIKEKDYIPGRLDPSGGSDEQPGKVWTGKQCLFIDNIAFVGMEVTGVDNDGDGISDAGEVIMKPHEENGARFQMLTSDSRLTRLPQAQRGSWLRAYFQQMDAGRKGACPVKGFGHRCPRVAIWAHGAPAPCSIWPF